MKKIQTNSTEGYIDKLSIAITLYAILYSMAFNGSDTTLDTPNIHIVFVTLKAIAVLLGMVYFTVSRINRDFSKNNFLIFASFLIFMLYNYSTFDFLSTIAFFIFSFSCKNIKFQSYQIFRRYLIITGILGCIAYISFVLRLPFPPYQIVPFYGEHMTQYLYVNYNFAYLVLEDFMPRQCGLFNEPGFYGTMAALVLIIENLNLKRKGNVILLVSSIFTLSMAFFVLVGGFVVISNLRRPVRIVYMVILFLVLVLILHHFEFISSDVIETFIDRFTIEDGNFKGNNRSTDRLDVFYDSVYTNIDLFLFGYGPSLDYDFGAVSSYKVFIVKYGVFRCLIIWGLLMYSCLRYTKGEYLKYCLLALFAASIYQRPSIFELCYYVTLFGGMLAIQDRLLKTKQ